MQLRQIRRLGIHGGFRNRAGGLRAGVFPDEFNLSDLRELTCNRWKFIWGLFSGGWGRAAKGST
jgi:hypothetical protein